MPKKSLTKNERWGILIAAAIVALYFYYGQVYTPMSKKVRKAHKQVERLSNDVKTLRSESVNKSVFVSLEQWEQDLQKAKPELDKIIESSLPKREDVVRIITKLSEMAAECDLKIRILNPIDETDIGLVNNASVKVSKDDERQDNKEDLFKRNYYNLVLEGNFINAKRFLQELMNLPKLVGVERLLLERESEEQPLKITLVLSMIDYSLSAFAENHPAMAE